MVGEIVARTLPHTPRARVYLLAQETGSVSAARVLITELPSLNSQRQPMAKNRNRRQGGKGVAAAAAAAPFRGGEG